MLTPKAATTRASTDDNLQQQLQNDSAVRDHARSEGAKQAIYHIIIAAIYIFPICIALGYICYFIFLLYTRRMDEFWDILTKGSYLLTGGVLAELARLGIKLSDEK